MKKRLRYQPRGGLVRAASVEIKFATLQMLLHAGYQLQDSSCYAGELQVPNLSPLDGGQTARREKQQSGCAENRRISWHTSSRLRLL